MSRKINILLGLAAWALVIYGIAAREPWPFAVGALLLILDATEGGAR